MKPPGEAPEVKRGEVQRGPVAEIAAVMDWLFPCLFNMSRVGGLFSARHLLSHHLA